MMNKQANKYFVCQRVLSVMERNEMRQGRQREPNIAAGVTKGKDKFI